MYSQKEMQKLIIPLLKLRGNVYKKYKAVKARKAVPGEKIVTITSDGVETENVAGENDFIVENQTEAREKYIVSADKFETRYSIQGKTNNSFQVYTPKGKILAIRVNSGLINALKVENGFRFQASWNEPMAIKAYDYLVCPLDYSEVYRIANNEFLQTYKLDQ